MNTEEPYPLEITICPLNRVMHFLFSENQSFNLTFEYLRIYSPSAEMKMTQNQELFGNTHPSFFKYPLPNLIFNKSNVLITKIEPIGQYAIKPYFSDGHATGLYSWSYLYWLSQNQEQLMQIYKTRLHDNRINTQKTQNY